MKAYTVGILVISKDSSKNHQKKLGQVLMKSQDADLKVKILV